LQQKNNIIRIIEFLDAKSGYLKVGNKKLSKKLKVSLEELKTARKLIRNQGFNKVLKNFKDYGTSYDPVDVSFNPKRWMDNLAKLNYVDDFPEWVGTSEKERKEISLEEVQENPQKTIQWLNQMGIKFIEPTTPNTLFISDLHLPYTDKRALEFCKKLYHKYNIEEVVFVGDVFDFYGLSVYGKSTSYLGIKNEIEVAKLLIQDWYKEFPNATLLYGNHANRLMKKLELAGIPEDWLRELEDILEIPNWKFVTSYETDDYVVIHGTGGLNMQKTVLARGKSIIQGHHHSKTKLDYITNNLWTMQLGALIDLDSYAFHYTKENPIPAIASCGILYNGNPIIETLK